MDSDQPCIKTKRRLYGWEIQEARQVFGHSLRYEKIIIHECATWTDSLDRLGRKLKRLPPLTTHNAVTLGNHCYFPVNLPVNLVRLEDPEYYKLAWLVHELTHTWQYQHMGWGYLLKALSAQFRGGSMAYDFGHAEGLKTRRGEGWTLTRFNLEQQGDIARSYYERLCKGLDTAEWQPFIDDIQKHI